LRRTSTTVHPASRLGLVSQILIMGGAALVAAGRGVCRQRTGCSRKYLVRLAGCTDWHTPGHFLGKPDMSRYLAGSEVGLEVPGVGTVVGRNLTPDKDTGIGRWTLEQITTAIRTGVRPDGRSLSPIMPFGMSQSDADAIAIFLKTLPPVKHNIPGPFTANEKPTTARWRLVPPETSATVAAP